MAGADTILKLIATVIFIPFLLFVMSIGYTLMEPIYEHVVDAGLMTELSWGSPQDVVLLFVGLALIGLGLVVFIWWIVSPIRDDVRQDVRRPPF